MLVILSVDTRLHNNRKRYLSVKFKSLNDVGTRQCLRVYLFNTQCSNFTSLFVFKPNNDIVLYKTQLTSTCIWVKNSVGEIIKHLLRDMFFFLVNIGTIVLYVLFLIYDKMTFLRHSEILVTRPHNIQKCIYVFRVFDVFLNNNMSLLLFVSVPCHSWIWTV